MQRDTYQQRRLEAALVRDQIATSWRQYLSDAYRHRAPASAVAHQVHALGVMIDQRTLSRWMRQAAAEIAQRDGGAAAVGGVPMNPPRTTPETTRRALGEKTSRT